MFRVSIAIRCEADPPNPGVQLLNPGGGHFLWGDELFYACAPGSFLRGPASRKCGFAHGQARWSGFNPLCEGMGVGACRWEGRLLQCVEIHLKVYKECAEGSGTLQCGRVSCSGVSRWSLQWSRGTHMFINI